MIRKYNIGYEVYVEEKEKVGQGQVTQRHHFNISFLLAALGIW